MKKFSKLILESKKKEILSKHPLVNQVDWDEIFKPLIEHIEGNLKSTTPPPGEGIFSDRTKVALDTLIDQITEDYAEYYINVIGDDLESLLNAYSINTNQQDVLDCLQTLSDRTNDIDNYAEWDWGCYVVYFRKIKYKSLDELIEDIEDIHLKLKMLKVNYAIRVRTLSRSIEILESTTDISNLIKSDWKDSWAKKSEDINLFNGASNSGIEVYIFNKDTIEINDFDYV